MRWVVKLLALVGVVIIVSILTFLMTDLLPGDPAEVIAGSNASDPEFVDEHPRGAQPRRPAAAVRYLTLGGRRAATGTSVGPSRRTTSPSRTSCAGRSRTRVQLLLLAEIVSILIAVPDRRLQRLPGEREVRQVRDRHGVLPARDPRRSSWGWC